MPGGARELEGFDLAQGVPLFPLFYSAATGFHGLAGRKKAFKLS